MAVVYASASPSLAALEMLVQLQAQDILPHLPPHPISFDDSLVEEILPAKLPADWRDDPAPAALQVIGDEWVGQASSAVLRVPSVVIDCEWNYLFNPKHRDFARCRRGKARPFKFDSRLVK